MSIQLIIKAEREKIEKALGSLTSECEIFPVAEGLFGISISERSLSSAGEAAILKKLEPLTRLTCGREPGKNPSDGGFGKFQR